MASRIPKRSKFDPLLPLIAEDTATSADGRSVPSPTPLKGSKALVLKIDARP
jgi:hypothetical protein